MSIPSTLQDMIWLDRLGEAKARMPLGSHPWTVIVVCSIPSGGSCGRVDVRDAWGNRYQRITVSCCKGPQGHHALCLTVNTGHGGRRTTFWFSFWTALLYGGLVCLLPIFSQHAYLFSMLVPNVYNHEIAYHMRRARLRMRRPPYPKAPQKRHYDSCWPTTAPHLLRPRWILWRH